MFLFYQSTSLLILISQGLSLWLSAASGGPHLILSTFNVTDVPPRAAGIGSTMSH